jgi:hypothetical protein
LLLVLAGVACRSLRPTGIAVQGLVLVTATAVEQAGGLKMTKLTDAQLIILSTAARHADGPVPLPNPKSIAGQRSSLVRLVKDGLVVEVCVPKNEPAWSKDDDGRPLGFKITDAGLAAIGIGPEGPGVDSRPTLANPTAPATPAPQSRSVSKIENVVLLLSRENGASISELMVATGWLPHSTRAALTGLRKKGYAIVKHRGSDGVTTYEIERAGSPEQNSDGTAG